MASGIRGLLMFTRYTYVCTTFNKQYLFRKVPILQVNRCLAASSNDYVKNNAYQDEQSDEEKDKYSPEHRKRLANYYSLFVGSLIGIISSSYLLYKKLGQVETEAMLEDCEKPNVLAKSKVLHKSEAGFKERKVFFMFVDITLC